MEFNMTPYETYDYEEARALCEGLGKITDQRLLLEIYLHAHCDSLKTASLEQITQPALLAKAAKGPGKPNIWRATAFSRLGRPADAAAERLKALRQYDGEPDAASDEDWALLEQLGEEKYFVDIANHARWEAIAKKAAKHVTSKAALQGLADHGRYWGVRVTALEALGQGEKLLAEYAQHGGIDRRLEAIGKLTDLQVLAVVRDSDDNRLVRRAARYRLHFLATGEDSPLKATGLPFAFTVEPVYDLIRETGGDVFHVEQNGKAGALDAWGRVVVPLRYDVRSSEGFNICFYEGLAAVCREGLWGFCDSSGAEVIPCQYEDRLFGFSQGLAAVRREGLWGFIDKSGKEVIPCQFENCSSFENNVARVSFQGKERCIDKTGQFCEEPSVDGFAPAPMGVAWGPINQMGEAVVPLCYEEEVAFRGGALAAAKKDGLWGVIDRDNHTVFPFAFDEVIHATDRFALVGQEDSVILVDCEGKTAYPRPVDWYQIGEETGVHLLCVGGKWGMWNENDTKNRA